MNLYDVIIAGAGPVGLTLAIELGQRGKSVLVLEKRQRMGRLPKMERCNARTMENFRRMGIAGRIRESGLDNDMPMDVFICDENITRAPLVHHHYPSVNELKAAYSVVGDGTSPAEPYQLISQYTLEPLLLEVATEMDNVAVEFDAELLDFIQDTDGVTASYRSAADGLRNVSGQFLVGCDGASSTVRNALNFELEGDSLLEMRQALFRADDLLDRIPIGAGRHYHVADDKSSFLIVQDDKRHFSLHSTVGSDDEMPALFEQIVGFPFEYETLYIGSWRQRLMLSSGYSRGRVFIAGDAAHLVIPTGGLGMNTGHGDAVDLAWKLSAVLEGWGGSGLLESYELERRPVGARNIAASRKATGGRRTWRGMWSPVLRERSEKGDAARAALAKVADAEQRWSNDLYGIELGYGYEASPVISYGREDRETKASGELDLDFKYTPKTLPGFRLPHTWLNDGRAIQDELGREYTLLCVDVSTREGDRLAEEFRILRSPFRAYSPDSDRARGVYGTGYILLRPDLHIAWMGAHLPDNVSQLAQVVTGNHVTAGSAGSRGRGPAVVA
jgi:2-polyprenyl-6-methoxyphenol hydroxylase-like FAD-dependent oxidoreductase